MNAATLARPLGPFTGRGLFSGREASVTLHPAPPGSGLCFVSQGVTIPATVEHVTTDTSWSGLPKGLPTRNTVLCKDGVYAATVEHVLSALVGLGITDARIELEGPEVPILDGSAAPFAEQIAGARVETGPGPEPFRLKRPLFATDERGGVIVISPRSEPGCSYTYTLDYGPDAPIPPQEAVWSGNSAEYAAAIAPARTFSLEAEARAAQAAGLFKHLTPREMLVIGPMGEPIDNAWRFPNEPARHKLLDLIGDLALLGRPLQADVKVGRGGHALTHAACQAVLREADSGGRRSPK